MTAGLLLDTHVWLWLQNDECKLSPAAFPRLEAAGAADAIFVASFSMYELINGVKRGRLQLHPNPAAWFDTAFRGRSVRVLDLTPAIALETHNLPANFQGDPGDRIIAATAIAENLTLLTHDQELLRFAKQGVLKALKVDKKKTAHA